MKIKLFLPILLLCTFLFCNITYAAEVSTGDAIVPLRTTFNSPVSRSFIFPNHVPNQTKTYDVSTYNIEDTFTLDFFFDTLYFLDDADFYNGTNKFNSNGNFDIDFELDPTYSAVNENYLSVSSFKPYLFFEGKKYYLIPDNRSEWSDVIFDELINAGQCFLFFEIEFKKHGNSLSYFETSGNIRVDQTHYILSITSQDFSYDLQYVNNTSYALLSNLNSKINQITSYFGDLLTKLDTKFDILFEKLDNDQDELINGFDSQTGNNAGSNFDSSAADLGAAEDSLFEAASYDNIDYSEFEDFFSLSGVSSALSLLKTLMESLYNHLGIFGVPITIGLILLVITRILGYQNFTAGGG